MAAIPPAAISHALDDNIKKENSLFFEVE